MKIKKPTPIVTLTIRKPPPPGRSHAGFKGDLTRIAEWTNLELFESYEQFGGDDIFSAAEAPELKGALLQEINIRGLDLKAISPKIMLETTIYQDDDNDNCPFFTDEGGLF